jgi:hypothetical protein
MIEFEPMAALCALLVDFMGGCGLIHIIIFALGHEFDLRLIVGHQAFVGCELRIKSRVGAH